MVKGLLADVRQCSWEHQLLVEVWTVAEGVVGNPVHTVAYCQCRDRGGTRCGCPTVEYRMVSAVVGVHLRAVHGVIMHRSQRWAVPK